MSSMGVSRGLLISFVGSWGLLCAGKIGKEYKIDWIVSTGSSEHLIYYRKI